VYEKSCKEIAGQNRRGSLRFEYHRRALGGVMAGSFRQTGRHCRRYPLLFFVKQCQTSTTRVNCAASDELPNLCTTSPALTGLSRPPTGSASDSEESATKSYCAGWNPRIGCAHPMRIGARSHGKPTIQRELVRLEICRRGAMIDLPIQHGGLTSSTSRNKTRSDGKFTAHLTARPTQHASTIVEAAIWPDEVRNDPRLLKSYEGEY